MKWQSGLLLSLFVLCGCTGTVRTEALNAPDLVLPTGGIDGIVVYPLGLFRETSKTTVLVSEKGAILGYASTGDCEPILSEKVAFYPDFSRPQRLYYESGILESNKFSVELKDGVLVSVNSESTPDRGETFKNVAAGLASLTDAGLFPRTHKDRSPLKPACNSGPVVVDLKKFQAS